MVSLVALGNASNIEVIGTIRTFAGAANLIAGNDIRIRGGDIHTSGGNVKLTADFENDVRLGAIELNPTVVIDAGIGSIFLDADGNVTVSRLTTTSSSDTAILIRSRSGQLIDADPAGDSDDDLVASFGGAAIVTRNGIGNGNAIETSIDRLDAMVRETGNIEIVERGAVKLHSVITADGSIDVLAGGTITANEIVSQNREAGDNDPVSLGVSRDIRLEAHGTQSSIIVENITAMNGADVALFAGNDVVDSDVGDDRIVMADDLTITTLNQADGRMTSIDLTTDVNDLVFRVQGANPGDVTIRERDAIRLASSDANDDNEFLFTSNGKITINAREAIEINDDRIANDTSSRRGDPEIIAAGDRGQISLIAGKTIRLEGGTQLEASSKEKESIFIDAPSVILGPQIQMTTGAGVGIARLFSLRPMPGLADTAFFDFTTVTTNRLSQENANDAIGLFTVLIGRQGEQGLTINIDWGDSETRRFEQYDLLPGNATFSKTHVYLEQDILNSTLNGRTSATAPLQVRFSVRHHESIVVTGDVIQQGDTPFENVAGRLLSSTDNPLTMPLFDAGTATFTIPNLTIPLAFVPVRQIIPEAVEPEIFVRLETNQFLATASLETKSASASSSISRDEFFQIRVLSLDSKDKDVVAPQRLPDNILSGDNLKELFARLPDGKYEIQYVIGDGNERTLLRFDLRDHEPIVPGDDFDGTQLKLEQIDLDAIKQELDEATKDLDAATPANASAFDRSWRLLNLYPSEQRLAVQTQLTLHRMNA